MKFLLVIAVCFFTFHSSALVNMRNGSYAEKWIDVISPGDGYDLRIERFYSSRSLFIGLFGFGWCSSIETKLEHLTDGTITLSECGGGIEVSYYPTQFDKKSPTQTVDQIVQYFQKTNKSLSPTYLKNLRTQLMSDTKQRYELASKLNLINTRALKNQRGTFVSQSKGLEEIQFDGKLYTRYSNNGTVERFASNGLLVQIIDKSGNWIKINHNNNKIAFIVDNKGRRLNFAYQKNGSLQRIFDGQKLNISYNFNNDNLISVTNAWGNTYSYEYDDQHNMTKIHFPKKDGKPQIISISYDNQNDWIKTFTDRDQCRQEFEFTMSRENPKNHYWSEVSTTCDGKIFTYGEFKYWYNNFQHSKVKYLHRSLDSRRNSEQKLANFTDVYFHPNLGKPISVVENTTYTGYAYNPNGLPNQKEYKNYNEKREVLDWYKLVYKFDLKIRKMIETVKSTLNKNGKVLMVTQTNFEYDKKRVLTKAKQPSGLYISVNYNNSGQINQLTDHKGTRILLAYDNISDKPTRIKHSSLGEVKISYDNLGDVADVSSPKGRNVASSVVQSFLEFIEFLGPAAEEELKL